jgi:hypothetical protein
VKSFLMSIALENNDGTCRFGGKVMHCWLGPPSTGYIAVNEESFGVGIQYMNDLLIVATICWPLIGELVHISSFMAFRYEETVFWISQ